MSPDNEPKAFNEQFADFLKFLQTLWGILAGISVLFPLSNVLIKIIPMNNIRDDPPGGVSMLSPVLITTLATLATLFVILVTFRQRDGLRTHRQQASLQQQAWIAFGVGLCGLVIYLIVYYGIYTAYYDPYGVMGDDPRHLIGDFLLLLSYGTFFAMMTRAFMLLGMLEYFAKPKPLSPRASA